MRSMILPAANRKLSGGGVRGEGWKETGTELGSTTNDASSGDWNRKNDWERMEEKPS